MREALLARRKSHPLPGLWWLLCAAAAGCSTATPAPATTPEPPSQGAAVSPIDAFAFPDTLDPNQSYLFYLHGRIIQEQGLAAVDPVFGAYEYEAILNRLAQSGLTIISEQRGKETDPVDYAARVSEQVESVKAVGVPSRRITIVGASLGGYLAASASFVLKDPELNFVLLGTCDPGMAREWRMRGMWLYGNVLAIRDEADTEYAGPCEELFRLSDGKGLGRHADVVLRTGMGHGMLYHPLEDWVLPTLQWANP